ncbi:MAG: hypothetical protein GVY08_09285 [Bacteroidetes bacterium]|nr:hypothetical protein [Bacteroidota bacterium]NBC27041.1 hypothetical protein [Bacteroidota bacterium]
MARYLIDAYTFHEFSWFARFQGSGSGDPLYAARLAEPRGKIWSVE